MPESSAGRAKESSGTARGITSRAQGGMKAESERRAALKRAGLSGRPVFTLRQVHGTQIIRVSVDTPPPASPPEADGLITDLAGPVLCVFVADCVPLYLWDGAGRAGGIFHAGWRGLAEGMACQAVAAFRRHYGIEAGDLRAEIGPHIQACCYRVGPETAARFRPSSVSDRGGALYLDLRKETLAQLGESGAEAPTGPDAGCTHCRGDLYFSHRRDPSGERMMAFIALEPRAD